LRRKNNPSKRFKKRLFGAETTEGVERKEEFKGFVFYPRFF